MRTQALLAVALTILLASHALGALPGMVVVYQRVVELGPSPTARALFDESFFTTRLHADLELDVLCGLASGEVVGTNIVDAPLVSGEVEFVGACAAATQSESKAGWLLPGKHRVLGEFAGSGRVTVTLWGRPS